MTNFNSSELNDPQPPVPGERERASSPHAPTSWGVVAVSCRAEARSALVAALAVSVAALTAGGSSGPGGPGRGRGRQRRHHRVRTHHPGPDADDHRRHHRACAGTRHRSRGRAEAQTPPAVEETTPVAPVEALAPTTFSVSGTVTGAPAGTTVSHHVQRSRGHVHRHRRRFRELLGERPAGR